MINSSFYVLSLFSLWISLHPHTCYPSSVSVWVTSPGPLLVGSEATLQCMVSKLNPGPTVEWMGPGGHRSTESQVVLSPVSASDAGSWQCKITYEGTVYTESLNIEVKGRASPGILFLLKIKRKKREGSYTLCCILIL